MVRKVQGKTGPERTNTHHPVDLTQTIKQIRSHLKIFDLRKIRPIPQIRRPGDEVRIYSFTTRDLDREIEFEEGKPNITRAEPIPYQDNFCVAENLEMAVSETPVELIGAADTCTLVTLYDSKRKVGALMHIDMLITGSYIKMIALALYKMGVLKGNHLLNVEAKILGVNLLHELSIAELAQLKAFLRSCSIRVLPDQIGMAVDVKLHLVDGQVEAVFGLAGDPSPW